MKLYLNKIKGLRQYIICLIKEYSVGGGSGAVDSVFGRSGNVSAQSGDYDAGQVDNAVTTNTSQTIGGTKTFSNSPIIPEPTTDSQAATKKYVDDNGGSGAVDSVNGKTGVVILDAGDINKPPYNTLTSATTEGQVNELKDELDAAIIGNGAGVSPQSRTTAGGETTWVVAGGNIPDTHQLFSNGTKLVKDTDYTVSGNTFTFDASYLPIGIEEQEYYPHVSVVGNLDTTNNSIVGDSQTATGDGATTIDWSLGNTFNFQFGAFNEVFTFTNPSKAGTFILKLVQDSVGSRTVTFPASVKWSGGAAPTLTTTATTGTDIITFYFDGTDYFAVEVLNFS